MTTNVETKPKIDDSPLLCGARQVGATIAEIDPRHVARYRWAAERIKPTDNVYDFGCGCGYGSAIIRCQEYRGIDHSEEAIAFANANYASEMHTFKQLGVETIVASIRVEAVVAFEVLEHLVHPDVALDHWHGLLVLGGSLFASVPQSCKPWQEHKFHRHDWTAEEFQAMLVEAGFMTEECLAQNDEGFFDLGKIPYEKRIAIVTRSVAR